MINREIMKQQGRFIAAVQNDPQRKEQLERVLGGAMELQFTLAKIEGLAENQSNLRCSEICCAI